MNLRWYQVSLTQSDRNVTDLQHAITVMGLITGEDYSLLVESEGLDSLGIWLVVLPEQWELTLQGAGSLLVTRMIDRVRYELEAEMP